MGETIAEVDEDGGAAGLPAVCFAEASCAVSDEGRLDLLVNHHAIVVLPVYASDWRAVAATAEIVGRLDAASAALAALDRDCDVLTAREEHRNEKWR